MKIRSRRIIMFAFIGAFFIIAPILIFYASGYRYDLKRNKIIKTGTLILESKNLKDGKIYLNNQLYEKPLNEKIYIYNLLPGEYKIKVEKEGYHSWQKNLSVKSGITTFANDIILFQNSPPDQIISGDIPNFYISFDKEKLVYLLKTKAFLELYLYTIETKEKKLIYRFPSTENIQKVDWAASSKKILIQNDKAFTVFNLESKNPGIEIKDITKFQPEVVIWDLNSDSLLYAKKENTLYQIDLIANSSQEIFSTTQATINQDFFIEGNDIFYIEQTPEQNSLSKFNLNFKTNKKIIDVKKSDHYQFLPSANNFLGLLDLNQAKLTLIKKVTKDIEIDFNTQEPVIELNATQATWNDSQNTLIYYNDFEISIFKTDQNPNTFINRYGQVIKKVLWYPTLQHIVVIFDNKIEIMDLAEENGTRNVTPIINFSKINNAYLDKKGQILYFAGQNNTDSGLYEKKLGNR